MNYSTSQHGILLVRTAVGQLETAKEHWISKFPAIAYFRNGEYLKYKGEPSNSGSLLKWLTSSKATTLSNQIEGKIQTYTFIALFL